MIFITNRKAGSFYNISDINRVEGNTKTISDRLNLAGYVNVVDTKNNWDTLEFFNIEDGKRYLCNINTLIGVYYVDATTLPNDMSKIDYVDANVIEENLESINDLIDKMILSYRQSGTFKAGQNITFRA